MKIKNKNITLYVMTAVLALLITAIMFTAHGLYPFGSLAVLAVWYFERKSNGN